MKINLIRHLFQGALHVEVRLTKAQMIDRMKSLMMDIRPKCPLDWKLEVCII
jgi:gamma-glutamyl:cysteine ligase YbdK (ATP-grasp superfamily)